MSSSPRFTEVFCRGVRRLAFAGLFLVPQIAFGQAAPILGTAPVRATPSTVTPTLSDSFSVDVAIDLSATTGVVPGGTAPAGLTAFRIALLFDRTRVELTAVSAGQSPAFTPSGLDATAIADANAAGRIVIVGTSSGNAPSGVVSVATLAFRATSGGSATIAADVTGLSLASAIQVSGATLFGPAAIPPRNVGGGVVVQTPPALAVSVRGGPSPVTSSGTIVYTIHVENVGGSTARNVVLTAGVPAGASFSAATGGGTLGGTVVTWPLGDLAAGSSTSCSR